MIFISEGWFKPCRSCPTLMGVAFPEKFSCVSIVVHRIRIPLFWLVLFDESLWMEWRHYNCKWVAKLTSFFFFSFGGSLSTRTKTQTEATESLLGVDRQADLCYLYRLSRFLPWGIVITYYISLSVFSFKVFWVRRHSFYDWIRCVTMRRIRLGNSPNSIRL
jgi:hypothetical protein